MSGIQIDNIRENIPKVEIPNINDIKLPDTKTGRILERIRQYIPTILILLVILYAFIRIMSNDIF